MFIHILLSSIAVTYLDYQSVALFRVVVVVAPLYSHKYLSKTVFVASKDSETDGENGFSSMDKGKWG